MPGEGRKDVSRMTRSNYAKCVEALQKVRQIIKDEYATAQELVKDEAASKAYDLTIEAEMLLESITPPWED